MTITTPILDVDEDATVSERLTWNAENNILPARYLRKDSSGNVIETPAELFERVAENVAEAEAEYDNGITPESVKSRFEEAMKELRFMPNSPTLMNAGTDMNQLSACFVEEPKDDMESIFDKAKQAALIFQSGGGVGYPFHHLRPQGSLISSTGGVASGPVSFMEVFDTACDTVKQGGKRRGAQMGILRIDHPDIGRFITAKRDEANLDNFNISAGITDDFLDALDNNESYSLLSPRSDFTSEFSVTEGVRDFYSEEYADNPASALDSGEGKTVESNLWRDYADNIEVTSDGETVPFVEKWGGEIDLEVGEDFELPAEFIWDIIIDGAWRNGEPGMYHYDWTRADDTYPDSDIEATNPSLVAGTDVLTDSGVVSIENLEGEEFKTRSLSGNWADAKCWKSGEDEELYNIETNTGFTHQATAEHEWPVVENGNIIKKRTDELDGGERVPLTKTDSLQYGELGSYEDGVLIGWLYGDGSITKRSDPHRADYQCSFTISQKDASSGILDFIVEKLKDITGFEYSPTKRNSGGEDWYEIHVCNQDIVNYIERFDVEKKENGLPNSIFSDGSEAFRRGFIDGLFSADSHVSTDKGRNNDKGRITLTTSREKISNDIVSLLSFYGIKAQQRHSKPSLNGNEYDRWDVTISNKPATRFKNLFKLSHEEKQKSLNEITNESNDTIKSTTVQIVSVKKANETADVWDVTVYDEKHTFPIRGITTGNCAEQPLTEHEACNLGHINLSLMVDDDAETWDEYDNKSDVRYYLFSNLDMESLDETIETASRFLENVVDQSNFPLDEIEETVDRKRKIGVGIMGLAQMLYQMGVPYDSEIGRDIAAEVMRYINMKTAEYSHELAAERGVFGNYDESKWSDPLEYEEWFKRHTGGEDAINASDGYPVRNHNQTTIAPTGTTSMIADTSGGCEPVYSVGYLKNVGDDIQGDDMLVEFDSYFIETLKKNDIAIEPVKEEATEQMQNDNWNGIPGLDSLPDELADVFVTTEDISPKDHTLMQRRLQEHVDSGISKTINLPEEATRQDVKDSYLRAVDYSDVGCPAKGVTVYRDGSRDKQVKSTSADMSEVGEDETPDPVELYESEEWSDEDIEKFVEQFDEQELDI